MVKYGVFLNNNGNSKIDLIMTNYYNLIYNSLLNKGRKDEVR